KESKVRLHPTSSLLDTVGGNSGPISAAHKALVSALASDWLVYDEMVRIGVVAHVRTVTLVSPLTVLLLAGPMRLPWDALSEPSSRGSGDCSSDSESEDHPVGLSCLVRIDNWIQFLGDPQAAHLALQLRHKLHALILRRLRAPNKPLTQGDEDVVRVVAAALSQEEQALSLTQPSGVGQRPRPLYPHSHPHEGGWSGGTSEDSQSSRSSSRRTSDTATPTLSSATPPIGILNASTSKFSNSICSNTKTVTIAGSLSSASSNSLTSFNAGGMFNGTTSGASLNNANMSTIFSSAASKSSISPSSSSNTISPASNATVTSCPSTTSSGNKYVSSSIVNTNSSNNGSIKATGASSSSASTSLRTTASVSLLGESITSITYKSGCNDSKGTVSSGADGGSPVTGKTRYFIIKASIYKQLEASHQTGLWAFTHATERKIVQAAQNGPTILVFTLHRGGQFNGYARFSGERSDEKCPDITNVGPALGSLYKIEWVKKWNVGFHQTRRLYNPYNDNMQVHMSRDGQEVEANVGEQLIRLWDKSGGSGGSGGGYKSGSGYMVGASGPPMMHDPQGPPPARHPLHPPHMGPMHSPFHHPFGRNYGNGYGYGGSPTGGGGSGSGNYRGGYRGGYRR
ncbi:3'-5' RNA helicase ythdc2, partial [Halocaridina rubra]